MGSRSSGTGRERGGKSPAASYAQAGFADNDGLVREVRITDALDGKSGLVT